MMSQNLGPRWNHNIHYHRVIFDAIPHGARSALDVGTGNGLLAAELSDLVPRVTAIDRDAVVLESARAESSRVDWVCGDVLTHPFELESFDVVASVATVHHLPDLRECLHRFVELTRPGGVVAVVGLARTSRPRDVLFHAVGAVQHRYIATRNGVWKHSAPTVWPPPHSYAAVHRTARAVMPGVRWRQLPMWRYALVWTKHGEPATSVS